MTKPYFTDPHHFWTGSTQFPLNYWVPLEHHLFYQMQIGFYLQVRRPERFPCWRAAAFVLARLLVLLELGLVGGGGAAAGGIDSAAAHFWHEAAAWST